MARQKKLTDDQIEQLRVYCDDLVTSSDELRSYLNDIFNKSTYGYVVVNALIKQLEHIEEVIQKLPDTADTNNWELYDDMDIYEDSDNDSDNDSE